MLSGLDFRTALLVLVLHEIFLVSFSSIFYIDSLYFLVSATASESSQNLESTIKSGAGNISSKESLTDQLSTTHPTKKYQFPASKPVATSSKVKTTPVAACHRPPSDIASVSHSVAGTSSIWWRFGVWSGCWERRSGSGTAVICTYQTGELRYCKLCVDSQPRFSGNFVLSLLLILLLLVLLLLLAISSVFIFYLIVSIVCLCWCKILLQINFSLSLSLSCSDLPTVISLVSKAT